jgi:8-amino-7-oxononanoate synthase
MALAARLESLGLRVPGIRPPTVAPGTARLRIALSGTHTEADVDRLLAALQAAAQDMEAA